MSVVMTKYERGPVSISLPDGSRIINETEITTLSDVRATPFGPMNFGYVHFGPMKTIIEHADGLMEETTQHGAAIHAMRVTNASKVKPIARRWWKFWKKQ